MTCQLKGRGETHWFKMLQKGYNRNDLKGKNENPRPEVQQAHKPTSMHTIRTSVLFQPREGAFLWGAHTCAMDNK